MAVIVIRVVEEGVKGAWSGPHLPILKSNVKIHKKNDKNNSDNNSLQFRLRLSFPPEAF